MGAKKDLEAECVCVSVCVYVCLYDCVLQVLNPSKQRILATQCCQKVNQNVCVTCEEGIQSKLAT